VKYTAIRSEGGLLPYDLLDEIIAETAPGQKAADFGLPKGRRVSDEIQRVWLDAQELWSRFKAGREKPTEKDPHGTTLTRDRWIGPLLTDPVRLSYDLHFQPSAVVLDGLTFAISHRAGDPADSPPVHIEGYAIELDKRPPKYRTSPQAMVQEFLNRSEPHLWGVVTNGLRFRLLRDSVRTARPTYLEFDLETILEGVHYNEFVLFYRLCHRTRLPQASHPPEGCWLEKYYQQSIEKGGRVRDKLRDGVEEALKVLGTGFLRHTANTALLEKIDSGKLNADQYHRQLLLLVYRLLFLTVAEDRQLVISIGENAERNQAVYRDNYSIDKLRERAEGMLEDFGFNDLWVGLTQTFKLFTDTNDTNPLGIPPLNGDLFSDSTISDLEISQLSNLDLLKAIRWLMFYREKGILQRVNYAALNVEEFGSVYESLLDFRALISKDHEGRKFELGVGSERKTTGSYYTRPELVRELIQSALVPVLADRLAEAEKHTKGQPNGIAREAKIKAILGISVCDPACGSGHFLLEAARRLGKELAQIRVGEDEPTPEQFHSAVRDVISHSIHGVDLNPLAVDLCKLALWLEGHWAGKPLSFLDHHIKCGNSLIGILDMNVLKDGICDEAFSPVTGDDKKVAAAYKKRNKAEREVGQQRLEFEQVPIEHSDEYAELFGNRLDFPEDRPSDVKRKAELFANARRGTDWWHDWTSSNLWTASFFLPLTKLDDPVIPTQATFLSYLLHHKDRPQMTGRANSLADHLRFFHWPLEFPEIFERGGFDVMIGNPPWEKIQVEERVFFAVRETKIAQAMGSTRKALIEGLTTDNPGLHQAFIQYRSEIEHIDAFIKMSGRFPLSGSGKMNTYASFTELFCFLVSPAGRAGILVPLGIATDENNKELFASLVDADRVISVLGFENEEFIFPTVHHAFKFVGLTVTGTSVHAGQTDFAFFCRNFGDAQDPTRHYALSHEDIRVINPNTVTAPIFRTKVDASLAVRIYRRTGIMVSESRGDNGWPVGIHRMLNPTDDSALFQSAADLMASGGELEGNIFCGGGQRHVPVYEAKMIHQYDHRFGTYVGQTEAQGNQGKLPELTDAQHSDWGYYPWPRYWIENKLAEQWIAPNTKRNWLLAYRRISGPALVRTAIACILPRVAAVDPCRLIYFKETVAAPLIAAFLACFNSLVFDYFMRQKVSGVDVSTFMLKQMPMLPANVYSKRDVDFIALRVIELVYAARDVKPFADDLWSESDEEFKIAVSELQPKSSAIIKNGHTDSFLSLPFVWDSIRREQLRVELDAYFAHLYGLARDELRYVLDPRDVLGPEFPSETFRVLKEREQKQYGEYRTQRLVLAAYDELAKSDRFAGEKRECTIRGKTWTVGD
jgi:hypothetical protein